MLDSFKGSHEVADVLKAHTLRHFLQRHVRTGNQQLLGFPNPKLDKKGIWTHMKGLAEQVTQVLGAHARLARHLLQSDIVGIHALKPLYNRSNPFIVMGQGVLALRLAVFFSIIKKRYSSSDASSRENSAPFPIRYIMRQISSENGNSSVSV